MTSHPLQKRIDRLQAQRAAQWLELLRTDSPADKAAFSAWCRESPVHIREFLEASWVHRELTQLEAQGQAGIDALLAEIAPQAVPLPLEDSATPQAARTSRRQKLRWTAAAAVGLLAVVASAIFWQRADRQFTTEIGEQRTVELADASVVKLNTDSGIEVNFAPDERKVDMLHGEAVFKVAHDVARPFRVYTRTAVVTAVGTQFNVYDRPAGTEVTVLEGRVRVMGRPMSDPNAFEELAAGEEALIAPDGTIQRVKHPDLQRVTAWSQRRLKFERASLEEIAGEFNRYNHTQLQIEGIAAGSRFYRGIFDADDPDALVALLEREQDLEVERRKGTIVIRMKDRSRMSVGPTL